MTLFNFLDLKFRNTQLQLHKEYSPLVDGKTKAVHELIGFQRWISKWFHIPILLIEYLLVRLHVISAPVEPEPPIKEQAPA